MIGDRKRLQDMIKYNEGHVIVIENKLRLPIAQIRTIVHTLT